MKADLRRLLPHLVPVLDLSRPDWAALWQSLLAEARDQGLGGILLRRGRGDQWRRISEEAMAIGDRPPVLMADLEQGAASQLDGHSWFPKALTLGATHTPDLARRLGEAIGQQARSLGLRMVLAPVADVLHPATHAVIGARSFGATPGSVGDMVVAFVRGCQDQGVTAVVKHFPGHGRCEVDSHHTMGHVTLSQEGWRETDGLPFRMAIESGVEAVMVGHLWHEGLDPGVPRPASRSPVIMRDLLRRDLGFRGIVLTDSLEMGGAGGGDAATARLAVEAGADLVIGPDIGVPRGSGTAPLRDVAGCEGKAGQLAREIAQAAVSWLACQSVPQNELFPVVLRVVPDRWGRTEWAAPLVASLQARGCTNVEGRRLIVSAASSSPEAVLEAIEIARAEAARTEPVVVACGAIDVARRATGRARVVFIGDATAASQEAVVMLLTNEIPHRGNPDLPTSPSPLCDGGVSPSGRGT